MIVSKEHYIKIHKWVKDNFGFADKCDMSKQHLGVFDWANISRCYLQNRKDWIKLCRSCHRIFDLQNMNVDQLKAIVFKRQELLNDINSGKIEFNDWKPIFPVYI